MKKKIRNTLIWLSVILSAIIWHAIRVEHAHVMYYLPSVDLYSKVTCTKDGFWCVGMSKDRNVLMNYHRDCPDTIDHVYAPISEMTPGYIWYFRNRTTDTLFYEEGVVVNSVKMQNREVHVTDSINYFDRTLDKGILKEGYLEVGLMYDGWQGWGKIHLCTSDSTEIELKRVFL